MRPTRELLIFVVLMFCGALAVGYSLAGLFHLGSNGDNLAVMLAHDQCVEAERQLEVTQCDTVLVDTFQMDDGDIAHTVRVHYRDLTTERRGGGEHTIAVVVTLDKDNQLVEVQ